MELRESPLFCDDVNTDYIISGKYKFKTRYKELAKHVMEDLIRFCP